MNVANREHRTVALLLILALVLVAGIAPADAKKKKKKKKKPPVSVEVDYFLSSSGCPSEDANVDFLVTTDVDDEVECWYTASGLRNDVMLASGQQTREAQSRYWDVAFETPIVLDTSKVVSGEVITSGPQCVVTGVPCSPSGISAGEVILEMTLLGTIAGEEVELGTQVDTFQVLPGQFHHTELEIAIDPAAAAKGVEMLQLVTWIHGESIGHGVIKTRAPESSFIKVPTLVPAS